MNREIYPYPPPALERLRAVKAMAHSVRLLANIGWLMEHHPLDPNTDMVTYDRVLDQI